MKMQDIQLNEPFFSLPSPGIEGIVNEFVLDHEIYEAEMANRNGGLDLSALSGDCLDKEEIERFEQIIPYHNQSQLNYSLLNVFEKAKQHPQPLSKKVKTIEELEKDILTVYQVAYAHYVIAKNYGFGYGTFPRLCCGRSGRGMTVSLWVHGFLNAAYVLFDGNPGHAYVILPFVMSNPRMEGVILADPTSEQLGKYKGKKRRNLVTIKQGTKWKYKTEWGSGKNLFPTHILHLGRLLTEGVIDEGGMLSNDFGLYLPNNNFLEQAFLNPVKLENK